MIPTRQSSATKSNPNLQEKKRRLEKETNTEWVSRVTANPNLEGQVLLLGGTALQDFRIRVAQSHVRQDLLPSFWSHVALFGAKSGARDWILYEVQLNPNNGFGNVPKENGVQEGKLSKYDDPERFPNIACIDFFIKSKTIDEEVSKFRKQRSLIDIGALIVQ